VETVLFLAHTEPDGSLPKVALEALDAAVELAKGGKLVAGLFGGNVAPAAETIAGCGAAKVLGVAGEAFAPGRYATDAAAAEALIRASGATVVIAPATSRTSRALPGVAHRVGGQVDTHITAVGNEGGVVVSRWFYRQRMEARLKRAHRPWILLVDAGTRPAWKPVPGNSALELLPVDAPASRTTVKGVRAPAGAGNTIKPDAKLLFVAGAGWTKKQADGKPHVEEAGEIIQGFLARADASLGSSKSLVDQGSEGQAVLGFMSHLNQVGQTGSTPRHPKGLATCCHGEEPHVVGWRFINERRAVNLDPNCGWARGKADVLYVGDAFAVMKKVNELLTK
jgi:electron transfer flavoprotein alpha subunit